MIAISAASPRRGPTRTMRGVAAGPLGVTRSDLVEELGDHLGVMNVLHDLAPRGEIAPAGLGDHLLDVWPQHLGLGDGGGDALIRDE